MPDLPSLLSELESAPEWAEIVGMLAARSAPQALAVIIPGRLASVIRDRYAQMALCLSGTGADECDSCRAWAEDGHPDLVVAGRWGDPPGVADCLSFQASLYLRPVVANGRLGVIGCAENLSVPAANALLKITEEPPEGVRLLFVAEQDHLIPTIRSRVWTVRFASLAARGGESKNDEAGKIFPETPAAWAAWLERTKKYTLDDIEWEINFWTVDLAQKEQWRAAAALKNAIAIARKRHMPISMVQDAVYALLREGVQSEQIFGDLRET